MEANTVEDLFSYLPNEILGRIVSFLPNESALVTILLSTRWRNLWNEALVTYGTAEDITNVVAAFLNRFEELDPLKHPRKLQFHFSEEDNSVLLATIATNSKLLLDFSSWKKELFEVQYYELQFKINKQPIIYQSSVPSTTFLVKTLYLKSVSYLTTEVASSIVSNLEHLENLVIIECRGLESLSIESESLLQKLTILDCLELKSLHLRTSKLKSFRYRGPMPLIRPEYHFNLSDAMLDFRLGPSCSDFNTKNFDATLLTIKNSQVLTLCQWTFEALIWPSISPSFGSFKFYKLREMWWIDSYMDEHSIYALLSFLKLCPALEKLYVTVDPKSYSVPRSNSCFLAQDIKCTELMHLKLIKFTGFTSLEDEIRLVKSLFQPHLVNGKLPKIETSDGSCLDSVFRH